MSQRIINRNKAKKNKAAAIKLTPRIWIGKNGINDSVVRELKQQLKINKFVKVRILRSALLSPMNRHDIAEQLERQSGAPLIELKGYTAVYRSPYRKRKEVASRPTSQRK
ncbi:MAG: YhbY family RNA-binding protein [Euryarchaeota archaeon]|nr:YhbY family RNA-binding protein [Euryarchaeota archaeon]